MDPGAEDSDGVAVVCSKETQHWWGWRLKRKKVCESKELYVGWWIPLSILGMGVLFCRSCVYSGIRVGGQFHLPLEEILLKKIALCEILARVHHTVSDAANVGSRLRQVK